MPWATNWSLQYIWHTHSCSLFFRTTMGMLTLNQEEDFSSLRGGEGRGLMCTRTNNQLLRLQFSFYINNQHFIWKVWCLVFIWDPKEVAEASRSDRWKHLWKSLSKILDWSIFELEWHAASQKNSQGKTSSSVTCLIENVRQIKLKIILLMNLGQKSKYPF